ARLGAFFVPLRRALWRLGRAQPFPARGPRRAGRHRGADRAVARRRHRGAAGLDAGRGRPRRPAGRAAAGAGDLAPRGGGARPRLRAGPCRLRRAAAAGRIGPPRRDRAARPAAGRAGGA
ncbi:MAG: hypothetical protein AVDCRST_MAG08-4304, partial [uncultured Acetobacteraceae bacterium]